MWRDGEGRLHTLALPDPVRAFQDDVGDLLTIDAATRAALDEVLEDAEDEVVDYWREVPVDAAAEDPFVNESAPPVVRPLSLSPSEVAVWLGQIDLRWRLDVILALQDFLDA